MKKGKPTRRSFLISTIIGATSLAPFRSLALEQNINAFSENGDQKNIVFLFQGDSITDGNRGRTADPNHIMGHGYAFSIASRIGADFPAAGFSFYNRGVSGNTITDLQSRWQQDTLAIKPAVLSILIGINDVNAVIEGRSDALSVDQFESVYRQLLNDARALNPHIIFVLGLPFVYPVGKPKDNWNTWNAETLQRAERVKVLVKEFNAILVDYPSVFEKAITRAPVDYWIWDGIHPTVPAHELMARAWINEVSKRLPFLKKYIHST